MRALLLAPLLLAGCLDSPVGYYDFESITPLVVTCGAGVDAGRAAEWTDAVRGTPPDDLRIASGETSTQAQFFRADDSVFLTDLLGEGGSLWSGEAVTENATVEGADLGSDYSSLLEADSVGCEFDLRVAAELTFREDAFEVADGRMEVEISESQISEDRCPVVSCLVEYGFVTTHTASGNPGLWVPRE
jgi:hypothetical protein